MEWVKACLRRIELGRIEENRNESDLYFKVTSLWTIFWKDKTFLERPLWKLL